MRKLFLGAAALVAMAAPTTALAGPAYVGLDYASTDVDGFDTTDAVGLSGAVEMSPNFAADFGVSTDDDVSAWGFNAHLFTNNSNYLLGAFGGITFTDGDRTWNTGVEGQYYLSNVTLAAAVSYAKSDDFDVNALGVNGEARYFINDNFRLEAGAGWFNAEAGGGEDDVLVGSLGGEFQFSSVPVSVGLGYSHLETDETDLSSDTISATLRYNFGSSLRERDRSGAALAGLSGAGSALGF